MNRRGVFKALLGFSAATTAIPAMSWVSNEAPTYSVTINAGMVRSYDVADAIAERWLREFMSRDGGFHARVADVIKP